MRERQRKGAASVLEVGGGKIIRRLKKYPAAEYLSRPGAGGQKKRKNFSRKNLTLPKTVAECRKYPIPYLNTLRDHSITSYITKNTMLIH